MHEPLVNLSLPRVASWTAALMVAASLQASPAHAGSNQRLPPLDSGGATFDSWEPPLPGSFACLVLSARV